MKLLLTLVLLAAVVTPACVHPTPDPGTIVVSCVTDASKDPKLLEALLNALAQPNFIAAITSLISPALGWTAEVVACALHSFLGVANDKPGATPVGATEREHARAYLRVRGYQVP